MGFCVRLLSLRKWFLLLENWNHIMAATEKSAVSALGLGSASWV